MNIANRITLSRIILTFVFMFLLFCRGFWWKLAAFLVFLIAAISDFLDGFIAKRKNAITDFGRLMDPVADKILVLAAFACFVQMHLIEAWMFMIIIAREVLITSLRLFALNKGKVLSAGRAGKHKTIFQMSVVFCILGFILAKEILVTWFVWNPAWEDIFHRAIYFLMCATVGLTLYSGFSYLWKNRKIITRI